MIDRMTLDVSFWSWDSVTGNKLVVQLKVLRFRRMILNLSGC